MFRAVSKAVLSGLSASKAIQTRTIYVGVRLSKGETPDDFQVPPVPVYKYKANETMQERRARLLYQSRKRGMLENGLLLSQFAKKFLDKLTDEQVLMYDKLINLPSNDWDIYYWATNKQEPPKEFENEVLEMLREHATNKDMESRIRQPDLYT